MLLDLPAFHVIRYNLFRNRMHDDATDAFAHSLSCACSRGPRGHSIELFSLCQNLFAPRTACHVYCNSRLLCSRPFFTFASLRLSFESLVHGCSPAIFPAIMQFVLEACIQPYCFFYWRSAIMLNVWNISKTFILNLANYKFIQAGFGCS